MPESSQGKENPPRIVNKATSLISNGQAELWNRAAKKVGVHFDIMASEGKTYDVHHEGRTFRNVVPKGKVYAEITSPSYDIHQDFWKAVKAEEMRGGKNLKDFVDAVNANEIGMRKMWEKRPKPPQT